MLEVCDNEIIAFHRFFMRTRKEIDYEMGQIGNMDEVILTFDIFSIRIVVVNVSKIVKLKRTGHEKRITTR